MKQFAILSIFLMVFAGCVSNEKENTEPTPVLADVFVSDRVSMEIPVPVVLIGFEEHVAENLSKQLPNTVIDHYIYDNPRGFITDSGFAPQHPNWMLPAANFTVYNAPLEDELQEAMEANQIDGFVNATAIEDWLAENLDVPFSKTTPALVYYNLDGQNTYRVKYSSGHIDQARIFGERHGLLIMDTSAAPDPWVGSWNDWEAPLQGDLTSIASLTEATLHATHFRLLQGPLYPPSLRECHGITLLVASRATTLTETVPEYDSALSLTDTERLTTYWEALLGEGNVHVDKQGLLLPVDDPVLDGLLRYGDLDALRWHFDENWADYWVPHEGCEQYISLYLVGDATDSGISGIAMFDIRDGRRFSLSNFNDLDRMRGDEGGTIFGTQYQGDESIYTFDWVNFLFSHETGHLFGQRHPHDVSTHQDTPYGATWSSGWTAMSYQVGSKNPEFGSTDHNNHWRNKAASAIIVAHNQGHAETPEFTAALEFMAQYDWVAATEALQPIIDPTGLSWA